MNIPVLFLHGWAMNGAFFQDVIDRLGDGFDCHAPDLPGHGANLSDDASLDRCVELIEQWVEPLDRPILVGWSMGAGAAWRYVARSGTSKLRGLATIDMSPRILPDTDWQLGMLGQSREDILSVSPKIVPHWHRMVKSIITNLYAKGSETPQHSETLQSFLDAQDPHQLRPLWDDLTAMDERATISQIDIPYLALCGAQSRLYSVEVAGWLVEQAQNARMEVFENAGHSPHLESPQAFCDALRRFAMNDCAKA